MSWKRLSWLNGYQHGLSTMRSTFQIHLPQQLYYWARPLSVVPQRGFKAICLLVAYLHAGCFLNDQVNYSQTQNTSMSDERIKLQSNMYIHADLHENDMIKTLPDLRNSYFGIMHVSWFNRTHIFFTSYCRN